MNSQIPQEAVEAAAKKHADWEGLPEWKGSIEEQAREMLEAAYPFLVPSSGVTSPGASDAQPSSGVGGVGAPAPGEGSYTSLDIGLYDLAQQGYIESVEKGRWLIDWYRREFLSGVTPERIEAMEAALTAVGREVEALERTGQGAMERAIGTRLRAALSEGDKDG